MRSKRTVYTLAGTLAISVLSLSTISPSYVSSFHTTYFQHPETIIGKNLPPGIEDLTLYLFFQVHHDPFGIADTDPVINDSIANCQLGIYRELETLYKERKISSVFFEGAFLNDNLTAIVESYYPSVTLLQEKRQELSVADDAKLKALFMLPDDNRNDVLTLFPLQYGNLPDLLLTGWEDPSSELLDHLEYKVISWRYQLLSDNQHRTSSEEIEFQRVGKKKSAMDNQIGFDRTRQAYENSFSQGKVMLDARADLPHGYAVVIGLGHAHKDSMHGSAYADITFSSSYPNAHIYECQPSKITTSSPSPN